MVGGIIEAGSSGVMVEASLVGQIVATMVFVNLGFFIFNMLPIPPLDGSRVLYALAPEAARRIMEQIERYGIMLVMLVVVLANPLIGSIMQAATSSIVSLFMMIFQL